MSIFQVYKYLPFANINIEQKNHVCCMGDGSPLFFLFSDIASTEIYRYSFKIRIIDSHKAKNKYLLSILHYLCR